MKPRPSQRSLQAWLREARRILPAAMLAAAVSSAFGQFSFPPLTNLFGDDIVVEVPKTAQEMRAAARRRLAAEIPASWRQTLLFQNGSQLRGEIISLSSEAIIWKHPDAPEPLCFRLAEVKRVSLGAGMPLDPTLSAFVFGKQEAPAWSLVFPTVKLGGADWLYGDSLEADSENMRLQLDPQTVFTIPRSDVEWVQYDVRPAPACGFFGNASDLAGWDNFSEEAGPEVQADGLMKVKPNSWISRAMAMPIRFEVSFELPPGECAGQQIWLQPYFMGPNSFATGSIKVSFGEKEVAHTVYVRKFDEKKTALPEETETGGSTEWRVLYDGIGERLYIVRNGTVIVDRPFREPAAEGDDKPVQPMPRIRALIFGSAQGGAEKEFRLRSLRMQPWDGSLPGQAASGGGGTENFARLSARDREPVNGVLEAIDHWEITLSGAATPVDPGMFLRLPGRPREFRDGACRLMLGAQGELTASELRIEGDRVKCRTSFSSELSLPASLLRAILFPIAPHTEAKGDVLVFQNGDELSGTLLSAETDGVVKWKLESGQEAEFAAAHLAGVRLQRPAAKPPVDGAMELRGGDRIYGTMTGLDDGRVAFRRTDGSEISVNREAVWRIYPDTAKRLFDSESEMMPSTRRNNLPPPQEQTEKPAIDRQWVSLDGHFINRTPTVARPGNSALGFLTASPRLSSNRFEFSFSVTRPDGNVPSLQTSLRADPVNPVKNRTNQPFVDLWLSSQRASLVTMSSLPGARQLKSRQFDLGSKISGLRSRMEVRLLVDAIAGTLDLYVDGVHCADAGRDADGPVAEIGATVQLTPDASTEIISDIRLAPWDGEPVYSANAQAVLANGDSVAGHFRGFTDGTLQMETDLGPMEIPLNRVRLADFGEAPHPKSTAARARLMDGSMIGLDHFRWEGEKLLASSEDLGPLEFAQSSVKELIFHPAPVRFPAQPLPRKSRAAAETPDPDAPAEGKEP